MTFSDLVTDILLTIYLTTIYNWPVYTKETQKHAVSTGS